MQRSEESPTKRPRARTRRHESTAQSLTANRVLRVGLVNLTTPRHAVGIVAVLRELIVGYARALLRRKHAVRGSRRHVYLVRREAVNEFARMIRTDEGALH